MRPLHILLPLVVLVSAQSDAVTPHSVSNVPIQESAVSVHSVSLVSVPTNTDVSPHSVSMVPISHDPDLSVLPLSWVDAPLTLSWIPLPTTASTKATNKGKIAGGVVGGLAVVVAVIGACIFVRLRRRSTRHWRNQASGRWQDQEGKPSGGPVYVGRPLGHDVKGPIASPTTAAPLFLREPRIHRTHFREDSIEMQASPTRDTNLF
ncbi:hypothetical protein C8F01DRAFT_244021 [Mycena amicta]|nr:hypothetical protein C8F01DRAFT_244021 [Mycena amicta]